MMKLVAIKQQAWLVMLPVAVPKVKKVQKRVKLHDQQ
jgi:hypothetical protein